MLAQPIQTNVGAVAAIWALRTRTTPWLAALVALWPMNAFFWEFRFDLVPTALLAHAPDLTTFTLLRVAQGLCMAAAFTLTLAYLGEHYSAADSASAFAAYITGNVASNLIGRLISAAVADHFGLASNFYFFAGLNLLGAVLVYFTIDRTPCMTCVTAATGSHFSAWIMHLKNPALRASFSCSIAAGRPPSKANCSAEARCARAGSPGSSRARR